MLVNDPENGFRGLADLRGGLLDEHNSEIEERIPLLHQHKRLQPSDFGIFAMIVCLVLLVYLQQPKPWTQNANYCGSNIYIIRHLDSHSNLGNISNHIEARGNFLAEHAAELFHPLYKLYSPFNFFSPTPPHIHLVPSTMTSDVSSEHKKHDSPSSSFIFLQPLANVFSLTVEHFVNQSSLIHEVLSDIQCGENVLISTHFRHITGMVREFGGCANSWHHDDFDSIISLTLVHNGDRFRVYTHFMKQKFTTHLHPPMHCHFRAPTEFLHTTNSFGIRNFEHVLLPFS